MTAIIVETPPRDDPDPAVAAMYADDLEDGGVVFARRLTLEPTAMTDDDSADLRAHGYSDRQIVDIAIIAGARNFFSRTLQALAVPVDDLPRLAPASRSRAGRAPPRRTATLTAASAR
ncbi:hypothetical protein [Microbacterium sp. 10M-3C3]|jgi:hypothetical protein|uniref:hypothetical protein n=1 Tax=Microbacterium sp. 10M-3C3 TaxID=2483401 RepID=UPI000F63823F|nr:hypothetical protein [Microbacterium sp. 10M-3C3]